VGVTNRFTGGEPPHGELTSGFPNNEQILIDGSPGFFGGSKWQKKKKLLTILSIYDQANRSLSANCS